MSTSNDTRSDPSKGTRIDEAVTTLIEDLKSSGHLSEEQLQAVAGGAGITVSLAQAEGPVIHMHTYRPNSSTFNDDLDYLTDISGSA